jgi:hypothetical protein
VLAVSPVLRALLDVEPVVRHLVAVIAAAAASAIVVHAQLNVSERALALGHQTDRLFCLIPQRLAHALQVQHLREAPRATELDTQRAARGQLCDYGTPSAFVQATP